MKMEDGRGKHPNAIASQFKQKYNWGEPCDKRVALRVPESMAKNLPENWAEICRQALFKELSQEIQEKLVK